MRREPAEGWTTESVSARAGTLTCMIRFEGVTKRYGDAPGGSREPDGSRGDGGDDGAEPRSGVVGAAIALAVHGGGTVIDL